jgi:tetratricopeptide (TPR) repeat protein
VAAEVALLAALEIEPDSLDYLYALADHYLKRGKLEKARNIAEQLVEKHPRQTIGHEILKYIDERLINKKQP